MQKIGELSPVPIFLLLLSGVVRPMSTGQFEDTGQRLGGDSTFDVGLADLDGDGDLDAVAANALGNRVLINQGGAQNGDAGIFQNSNQSPGMLPSRGVALGDVGGNDSIDAFIANSGEREVWLKMDKRGLAKRGVLVRHVKSSLRKRLCASWLRSCQRVPM